MRLLVVSHACVTPINQQFFAEVECQTGWDLTILAPSNWVDSFGAARGLERWPAYRGALKAVPVWRAGSVPLHGYRSWLVGLLKEAAPDVIYVHHEPYAAATAQVYGANWVSGQRPIGFFTWQNIQKRYPAPFRQSEAMVYRQSAFAFPGSRSAEAVLRAKGYEGPSVVLPAGVDPERYRPGVRPEEGGGEVGREPEDIVIGYVGRVAREKGLETLLHALAQIRSLSWRLDVVGTGKDEADFDALASDLELGHRIRRLGYVPHPEAPRHLAGFDVLVLPSETQPNWKEQFGRVLIEAMACGTPVVGSDSGEIPHVIAETGGGVVFPEAQADALAGQLQLLISDRSLRRRLAEQGRRRVLESYTHAALAERFATAVEHAVRL